MGGGIAVNGYLLVELLFEISGLLFALAYKGKIEKGILKFKDFIKNRVLRIYPMMIISTCVMAMLEYAYYGITKEWWLSSADLWHLFISVIGIPVGWFEQNYTINMPIWYISVLFQCYMLAYGLTCLRKYKGSNFVYVLPILFALAYDYCGLNFTFGVINYNTSRGCKAFFLGLLLGEFLKISDALGLNKRRILLGCYSILIFIGIMVYIFGEIILGNQGLMLQFIIYPCIIIIVLFSTFWNRLLNTRGLHFLGDISFEIYLWNLPTQLLTFLIAIVAGVEFPYETKTFFILHMAVSLLIAVLFYKFVELPITAKIKSYMS